MPKQFCKLDDLFISGGIHDITDSFGKEWAKNSDTL